jgi:hypothetical protein
MPFKNNDASSDAYTLHHDITSIIARGPLRHQQSAANKFGQIKVKGVNPGHYNIVVTHRLD